MVTFECLKCGTCCRNLLVVSGRFTFGLALHPDETALFPSDVVFPYAGIGKMGHPKRIVEFQLGVNTCPHLERNTCRIYFNRPLACRSYPTIIFGIEPLKVYLEENCRWLKECIKTGKLTWVRKEGIFKPQILAPRELEAAFKLYEYDTRFGHSKDLWFFDLKRKTWGKSVSEEGFWRIRRRLS